MKLTGVALSVDVTGLDNRIYNELHHNEVFLVDLENVPNKDVKSSHLVTEPRIESKCTKATYKMMASKFTRKRFWWLAKKIYNLIVLVIVWFSFVWVVLAVAVSKHHLDGNLLSLVFMLIWTTQSAIMSTIFYLLGFTSWLTTVDELLEIYHLRTAKTGLKHTEFLTRLRKQLRVATVITILISTAITTLTLLLGIPNARERLESSVPAAKTLRQNSFKVPILNHLGLIFAVTSWINIVVFTTSLTYVLGQHFRLLSETLESRLAAGEDDFYDHLKTYRHMYRSLEVVVRAANVCLRWTSATHFISFIASILFSFFAMAKISDGFRSVLPFVLISTPLFGTALCQSCHLHEQVK